jgi:hypothetical protein
MNSNVPHGGPASKRPGWCNLKPDLAKEGRDMTMLVDLLLPVVVVTVVLFIASFLAWVVLPHHKPDVRKWPDEDKLLGFIRESRAQPGEYVFPYIEPHEMKTEEGQRRYRDGPWGMVRVWPARPNNPVNMLASLAYFFVVTLLIAYVGVLSLPRGADFGAVFQIVGTTAFLAYCAGGVLNEIWFTRPMRAKLMNFLDGVAYALLTGVLLGVMWP